MVFDQALGRSGEILRGSGSGCSERGTFYAATDNQASDQKHSNDLFRKEGENWDAKTSATRVGSSA
jgi:hypothetical protein